MNQATAETMRGKEAVIQNTVRLLKCSNSTPLK